MATDEEMRELHHFETEEENASWRRLVDKAIQTLEEGEYEDAYLLLKEGRELNGS